MATGRFWCFTLNNPRYLPDFNLTDNVRYAVFSEESGENGTYHLQGYFELHVPRGLQWCRNNIDHMDTAHLKMRYWNSTNEKAIAYAKKKDDTSLGSIYEYGNPSSQGTRSDIGMVFKAIENGTGSLAIAREHPALWCQYRRAFEEYRNMLRVNVTHQYSMEQFNRNPLDLSKPCLLVGDTNLGKTAFALAHFKKPLLCKHIDDLKKLEDHDGIVFDDMSFKHCPPEFIIALLEWNQPSSLHARHFNAFMPARMPRIFTHNTADIFFPEKTTPQHQQDAINRRYRIEYVDEPLFSNDNNNNNSV